jgi:hypothetical protein
VTGIFNTSPRLTEYGSVVLTKNGLNTVNFAGDFVKARPVFAFNEKPVIIQEVMVSGTFFVTHNSPVLKIGNENRIRKFKYSIYLLSVKSSQSQVSGNSFRIAIGCCGIIAQHSIIMGALAKAIA